MRQPDRAIFEIGLPSGKSWKVEYAGEGTPGLRQILKKGGSTPDYKLVFADGSHGIIYGPVAYALWGDQPPSREGRSLIGGENAQGAHRAAH